MAKPSKQKALNVSEARKKLSPLVEEAARSPSFQVPIAVRGKVSAYLVSAERMESLLAAEPGARFYERPPRLKGTLRLVGDIDRALVEAAQELEENAVRGR
ncbi:MAG: hypothetical protein HYZ28_28160 [Myxococcales bacterium]|nr:hypothetical protein [Myxococcales bacterium]